jgi:hypothetical protein
MEYSESADSISENLEGCRAREKRTWNKPIPDCFNWLTEWTLENTDARHFWFVEEDIVVPQGGLLAMLALGADIAGINYLLKVGDHRIGEYRHAGKLIWICTGCMLVRREVFERMARPWWRSDKTVALISTGSACKEKFFDFIPVPADSPRYGFQDINFCVQAAKLGFSLGVVEGMLCGHLQLEERGRENHNDGCHKITRVEAK